ncbi:MAG: LysM peptidoglycan-binding domain-containing protein [Chloroflexi bacterium]|nr:LysM peptidoglycan-binding domain-containing protein [Chloroflexota bacterium]
MSNKQRISLVISIFVITTLLISGCTQSLSGAPKATPTLIATGLFVSPFPSVENPMAMIEEFAKQTAAAQTMVANGGTPVTIEAISTSAPTTPLAAITSAPGTPGTPTNTVLTSTTAINTPSGPTTTPVPAGVRPATYTLQEGEFPYCIARRFNVDPTALLTASGLTSPDVYYAGLRLTIPQSGSFPGTRALLSHPATYSALSGQTLYEIACKYGDVDPAAIASLNGISLSATTTSGQQIKIP